jgi:hypothetical protein
MQRYPTWIETAALQPLLDERRRLLDRKFAGPWTRADAVRLEWIRWQLDNLEARGSNGQSGSTAKDGL